MLRKCIAPLLLVIMLLSLVGCGKDEIDIPDGMQLAGGGESLGYYFFVPETYTVGNFGEVSSAYVSKTTSVSLTEAELPAGKSLDEFFSESLTEYSGAVTVLEMKDCVFGNASSARSYLYTYAYDGHAYRFFQVLATTDSERLYIFTYGALDEEYEGGVTHYDHYFSGVTDIMKHVRFISKSTATDTPEYEKDSDGYILISDKSKCGFSLSVPSGWTVGLSSAIVTASTPDGSNINMSEATSTGVAVREYYENRKAELSELYGEVTEITPLTEKTVGNADNACICEYKFTNNGKVYRVYQAIIVAGNMIPGKKGYVFTYTATEENYAAHIDEVIKMTEKLEF